MRIILDDVKISDESLVALLKLQPGTSINVTITPLQVELQDVQVEARRAEE
jgi:hypothetical protein